MDAAERFMALRKRARFGEPCVHGHFGCSDVAGGKCVDEEFSALKPLDQARVEYADNHGELP